MFAGKRIYVSFLTFVLLLLTLFTLNGCCSRDTRVSQLISIGMTKEAVINTLGKPYTSGAEEVNGESVEHLVYRETTWDNGGWSWDKTIHDTMVTFKQGRVVSYGPYREHYNQSKPVQGVYNFSK